MTRGLVATMYSPDTEGWTVELTRKQGPPPGIRIELVFQNEDQAREFLWDLCPGTKLEDVPVVEK